ncbi:MAG: 30S ribosomal protein S8 [Campylobacterota bacterium]
MMTDVVADSLARIKNAANRRIDTQDLMFSNTVESIVKILVDKGYLETYKIKENGNIKTIAATLKYDDNGRSLITELKRVSKPGRRVYKGATEVKSFKNGYGSYIISTSKGVMANDEAYKNNVGGEVLCSIW